MQRWTEIRTAYQVAQLGTISSAAQALNIHRSTVTRHIDALEAELGGKIFLRHARGYSLTDLGDDLLRVAKVSEEQFNQLASSTKARSSNLTGELVVTSLEVISHYVLEAMGLFRIENPEITIKYLESSRNLNLEYGEAHVAIRAGQKIEASDNYFQHFIDLESGVYAHNKYTQQYGVPRSPEDLSNHFFVINSSGIAQKLFNNWLNKHISKKNIVFQSPNSKIAIAAIASGLGLGFMPKHIAQNTDGLIEVIAPQKEWTIPFSILTHVDQHETPKVQEFIKHLQQVSSIERNIQRSLKTFHNN